MPVPLYHEATRRSDIASDETALVARVLAHIPWLAGETVARVLRLPSRGNQVFRVQLASSAVVVRVGGRRRFIDVASEYHNQSSAAVAGLAPRPIGYHFETGAIVSEWIEALPPPAAGDRFCPWPETARSLARLHHCSTPFADALSPQYALGWNLTGPAQQDRRISSLAQGALDQCREADHQPLVNCHGDPGMANLLQPDHSGGNPLFIDWEFSHCSTAAWDIALLCNDATFDDDESAGFLEYYNGHAATLGGGVVGRGLVDLMRGVSALASAAWLINQGSAENEIDSQLRGARHFLGRGHCTQAPGNGCTRRADPPRSGS